MKLKTELVDVYNGKYASGEESDADHDAAAAHALLQAISEQLGSDERGPLLDRADELMREWGFE